RAASDSFSRSKMMSDRYRRWVISFSAVLFLVMCSRAGVAQHETTGGTVMGGGTVGGNTSRPSSKPATKPITKPASKPTTVSTPPVRRKPTTTTTTPTTPTRPTTATTTADSYYRQGEDLYNAKRYREALELYQKAAQLNPS